MWKLSNFTVEQIIKCYFDSDPNLYRPFLDDPGFSLAKVHLTLTFDGFESS
jgi:hypothetical protein